MSIGEIRRSALLLMDKRDLGITIGICASLIAHVGVMTYSADHYARTSLYYPAAGHHLPGVLISLRGKKPILPPDAREDIGESTGTGDSNFAALGDRPLAAPKADETQAWYSLQNPGQRSKSRHGQSNSPQSGDNGRGGPRSRANQALADAIHKTENSPQQKPTPQQKANAKSQQPRPPSPQSAPLALALSARPNLLLPSTTQPRPNPDLIAAIAAPPVPKQIAAPTPPAPAVSVANGDGRQPGATPAAGTPAPHSDTDSDPFTKDGSAVFHNGHVDVRFGRKVKLTRPNLLLAGEWDTFSIADPTVVLKIAIDPTGKVSRVDVAKSSGSNDIDQPSEVAAYDWWFEPRQDGKGHGVPDVILFTITYR